jgi:hypothetical protein
MKIKTFISVLAVALVLALPLISQTTSPGTFRAPTIKTGTTATSIYWTAGTIYNGGHAVSVAAGNAALGASQTSCAAPSFSACDFLYASSNGTVAVPTNATLTGACFLTGSSPATDKAIVILWNASGAVVANSALTGSTIAGSSIFQCIAFTGTYAAVGPQTFYVGLQTDGTHATEISTYPATSAPGTYGTGVQAAGVFGTLVNISSPSTAFNAGQGPVMSLY